MMGNNLTVTIEGNKVIVVGPGTDFWVSYDKRPNTPHLILTDTGLNWTKMSPEVSPFRAEAFQAAITKARQLGWIV
jgi:hypothetical protein